ncbi:methyltransferase (DUF6731) [Popillia japonica]|uniref:Methyltransferase (DUF6731) n=1 Tax=Popillia japonica TaxID=7064 RepID=A0AAW1HV18_POPJA
MYQEKTDKNGNWVDDGIFDFAAWICYIAKNDLERKAIQLKDTKARVERIYISSSGDISLVRLMKLREENIPYKAKENTAAEDIPLEPDEYIGEDMYILYDVNNSIAMVQSNRFSLGTARFTEFLIKSQEKEDERVVMNPITNAINLKKFSKNIYRNIELRFANINNAYNDKTALADIMSPFKKLDGVSGTISISVGRAKENSLDAREVEDIIKEIKDNSNVIGAKVKVKDDDDSHVEIIDLFEDIMCDIISFKIPERRTLDFETAKQRIVSVVFSLAMYMQASMSALVLRAIYISWLFFTVLFIAATYRSMTNMIKLVFSKDDDLINDEAKDVKKTEIDEETIKKYS